MSGQRTGGLSSSDFETERTETLYVVFVCTGNICRSPMAEVMFRDAVEQAKLTRFVRVRSCGIGGWHVGQGADKRAVAALRNAGLDGSQHRAAQLGDAHRSANLFIAADRGHVQDLIARGIPAEKIRLLRSFDPTSGEDVDLADPYYGDDSDFATTREHIEQAVPGMLNWVTATLATTSSR
ncbi:low molecular weight protein-tyrosine-phosphatase [Corynebacterium epidermidicanis]|uniref:protein-tyrosine-phosphatase n=1 Tax=Corynebacterium epidermidicanis TaxID=1050174 RepID=A0A0G3GQX3_9CORY|nr:low molecular weight protein-tyrosine-phosphatase [Corynebacterium epidermidicanis]AKK03606.1 protein-tyrosine-phosphatase [Corynebacterium epidermidicanis]